MKIDYVSRADVLKLMQDNWHTHNGDWAMQESMDDIRALPSVTPQEPREITLEDVKGYCKPRCLTIITNELLYELTHPKIKALEQEPFMATPCISSKVCEHDRIVTLNKIRAEIEALPVPFTSAFEMKQGVLEILDKYKAESEAEDENIMD